MKTLQDNLTIKSLPLFVSTLLLITHLFASTTLKAQCNQDDWTALKALYESTDGDNWTDNTEWQQVLGTAPPANCNLDLLYGVTLDVSGRVYCIDLDGFDNCESSLNFEGNNLSGSIPIEIDYLDNLELFFLQKNFLTGSIPTTLSNLINLEQLNLSYNELSGSINTIGSLINLNYLRLDDNQFTGTIPYQFGDLTNLTILNLGFNSLSGNIPKELGDLSNLYILFLYSNELSGSIPKELGNITGLEYLRLNSNNLSGSIPLEFGDLTNLVDLFLYANDLEGEIPSTLGNLSSLKQFRVYSNNLRGFIPQFSNPSTKLYIQRNYFSCLEIDAFDQDQILDFYYDPQYITPSNYNQIISEVVNTDEIGTSRTLSPNFSGTNSYSYQWKQNGNDITDETNAILNLPSIQASNAGKYTLHMQDQNCTLNIEFVSDPIYVTIEGYDHYGQEVEYNQIMIEFDNPTKKTDYEGEILFPNGGWEIEACNCNRELYLWQFPSTEATLEALVAINAKHLDVKKKNEVDGGFNNQVSTGDLANSVEAYNVFTNSTITNLPGDATIFLLDTGLDDGNNASSYLMDEAPVDVCYNIAPASGYNYTDDSCNTDFSDDGWHGTFGFKAITKEIDQSNDIKVVPVKIFDENGQGSLFDMTCAIYHAVDHNANIINLSAGYQGQPSNILENAINYARENGVFICTAAGNDTLNIDENPQYPAYFASQYHYVYDENGAVDESYRYDNVISVASIDADDNLSEFSNYGEQSVTISAYGDKVYSNGYIASGSSMATYFVTRELALEIAADDSRNYQDVWDDFASSRLKINNATDGKTITGKQLDVEILPHCDLVVDLIQNGDFSDGDLNWQTVVNASADADIEITDGKAYAQIEDGGDAGWKVRLTQENINIEKNKRYLISFKAKASSGRSINMRVTNSDNGQDIHFSQSVWLKNQSERKYFIFESKTIEDSDAKLVFRLGGNDNSVEIDDVVFKELSCTGLNNLVSNGYFDNDTLDWKMYINPVAQATRNVTWGFHRSSITNEGTGYWHLQFKQHGINLEPGTYTLSFRARSNGDRDIDVKLRNSTNNYYYTGRKNISTDWKTFNITIDIDVASTDGRLSFLFGGSNKNLFIDDVILVKESTASPRLSNSDDTIVKEFSNEEDLNLLSIATDNEFNVFPNPFTDNIRIDLGNDEIDMGELLIYNTTGKLIHQKAFENQRLIEVNTKNLLTGTYVLTIVCNDKIYSKKIVK